MTDKTPTASLTAEFFTLPISRLAFGKTSFLVVNAAQLHTTLKVGTEFRKWIKSRIEEGDLIEKRDYLYGDDAQGTSKKPGVAARVKPQKMMLKLSVALEMVAHTSNAQSAKIRQYLLSQDIDTRKAGTNAREKGKRAAPAQSSPVEITEVSSFEPVEVTEGMIGGVKCLVVDGRALWEKLGVSRDFSNWIKNRLEQYEFENGIDYEVADIDSPDLANQKSRSAKLGDSAANRGGDRRTKTYSLTLDTGKALAMVERTPEGKFVRSYFIECEKKLFSSAMAVGATKGKSSKLTADEIYENDCLPTADVEMLSKLTKARYDRCSLLAMRTYGKVLMLSLSEKPSEDVARAYQSRISEELRLAISKMNEKEASILTLAGQAAALAQIERWNPGQA